MIKKHTHLTVVDNCGVKEVKCIHHYFGSNKQTSASGDFLKCTVRTRHYDAIWINSKWVTALKKGKKVKTYVIRTKYPKRKVDGTNIYFAYNECLTLKKRMTPRGTYTFGPFLYGLGRKKVLASFAGVI